VRGGKGGGGAWRGGVAKAIFTHTTPTPYTIRLLSCTTPTAPGGEQGWLQYLGPKNTADFKEGTTVDKAQLRSLQEQQCNGRASHARNWSRFGEVGSPHPVCAGCQAESCERLFNEKFRVVAGVKFLYM
jgi:hypothetical protein